MLDEGHRQQGVFFLVLLCNPGLHVLCMPATLFLATVDIRTVSVPFPLSTNIQCLLFVISTEKGPMGKKKSSPQGAHHLAAEVTQVLGA